MEKRNDEIVKPIMDDAEKAQKKINPVEQDRIYYNTIIE